MAGEPHVWQVGERIWLPQTSADGWPDEFGEILALESSEVCILLDEQFVPDGDNGVFFVRYEDMLPEPE